MEYTRIEHEELGVVPLKEGIELVISKTKRGNADLGYTMSQRLNINGKFAYLKGTNAIFEDAEGILKLRNALNTILHESEEY